MELRQEGERRKRFDLNGEIERIWEGRTTGVGEGRLVGSSCCVGRVGVGAWGDAVRCLGTKAVKGTGLPPCAICGEGGGGEEGQRGRVGDRRGNGYGKGEGDGKGVMRWVVGWDLPPRG